MSQVWSWPPGLSPLFQWTEEADLPEAVGQVTTKDWMEIELARGVGVVTAVFTTWLRHGEITALLSQVL